MRKNIEKAVDNIIKFGDTDIFPFPFERNLFEDNRDLVIKYLLNVHKNFDEFLISNPPLTISKLVPTNYYAFRNGTQIEPFWNAYYLALIIALAEDIESKRVDRDSEVIYSYRYEYSEEHKSLFTDSNWKDYKKKCFTLAKEYEYVLETDISDFYSRINHHKLENELKRLDKTGTFASRILKLLSYFSGTISYGLPVGGPGSRILSELSLCQIDSHLVRRKIKYCRYSDDFTIFCRSESEAYQLVLLLADKVSNDQLSLQKHKTRILTSGEYRERYKLFDTSEEAVTDEQKLMNLTVRYDPYSPTAIDDYKSLKSSLEKLDIIGILTREVNKTKIDKAVTKQAIYSIATLEEEKQKFALRVLLDKNNLLALSPVFNSILRTIRTIYIDLQKESQLEIDNRLIELFSTDNYLVKIGLNLNYIVQVLVLKHSIEKEELLVKLYNDTTDHYLRRQIIIAMANWDCHYWLTDIKSHFSVMTIWERRAFIYASYKLGDEGSHWRQHRKKAFSRDELLIRDWFAKKIQDNKNVLS